MPEPIRVGAQGRLVIPASLRRLMGIQAGDELIPLVEEGRLVLATRDALLADIQAEFAAKVPPQVSLSDELLAERREEARREDEKTRREEASGPQGSA
jgi:AbrB family looped-hinge helix DNA binding protein